VLRGAKCAVTYELIPQPDAGYAEVRIDGRCAAKIDMALLNILSADAGLVEPFWLEAVAERPERKP